MRPINGVYAVLLDIEPFRGHRSATLQQQYGVLRNSSSSSSKHDLPYWYLGSAPYTSK